MSWQEKVCRARPRCMMARDGTMSRSDVRRAGKVVRMPRADREVPRPEHQRVPVVQAGLGAATGCSKFPPGASYAAAGQSRRSLIGLRSDPDRAEELVSSISRPIVSGHLNTRLPGGR